MKSPASRPTFTLFNTLAAVSLLFVISKLLQEGAWKFAALSAVFMRPGLAAEFYRAVITPKWLVNMYTSFAAHLLLVATRTTKDTAS